MVTSNHRCKGFMAATITATEMCGLSMTAELLGTGANGLLIRGTGREWFTFSLDPAGTGREWNQCNGTGLVFICIPVSLSTTHSCGNTTSLAVITAINSFIFEKLVLLKLYKIIFWLSTGLLNHLWTRRYTQHRPSTFPTILSSNLHYLLGSTLVHPRHPAPDCQLDSAVLSHVYSLQYDIQLTNLIDIMLFIA